jgi:hypothetical protein
MTRKKNFYPIPMRVFLANNGNLLKIKILLSSSLKHIDDEYTLIAKTNNMLRVSNDETNIDIHVDMCWAKVGINIPK